MTARFSLDDAVTSLRIRRHGLSRFMGVHSHTSREERICLFQIALFLPSEARALEIGSYLGSSALFLCAGLKHNHGHLYCVDTWMNETMLDGARDTYSEFSENTKEFESMLTPIRKKSEDVMSSDFEGSLDFAFIDGDHSERAVRSDFLLVSDWIKVGGFVAFHDLHSAFPGVNLVLGEALASGAWQIVGLVNSLGWIRRVK